MLKQHQTLLQEPAYTFALLNMAPSIRFLLLTLVGASVVAGAPVERRETIASNVIVGFPQTVPNSALGQLYLKVSHA